MVHSRSRSGSISSQSSTSSCSSSSEDVPIRDPIRSTPPRKPLNLDAIEKYHQWNVPYSQMPRGPDHGQWSRPAPSVLQTVTDIQTEIEAANAARQTQKQAKSRAKPYHVTSPKSIKKRDGKKNGSPQKKKKGEAQGIDSQAKQDHPKDKVDGPAIKHFTKSCYTLCISM
ncbi:hypothetical protein VNI00_000815 [Paramarasmius palmivorus]|uniref:Uncharacterized protein n=1 Tax=Paramarasmius palmivorus TaxID=297713 RepID=A0AAW0E9N5_9AGAR